MYGVKLSSVVAARASSSQPAYFDRVIAFVSIDVSPSRPLSSHWWTSRTRARSFALSHLLVLSLYSSEEKSVYGQCSPSCSMIGNESLNSLYAT